MKEEIQERYQLVDTNGIVLNLVDTMPNRLIARFETDQRELAEEITDYLNQKYKLALKMISSDIRQRGK